MNKLKYSLVLLLFCLTNINLHAAHILSGTASYSCLSSGEYEIRLTLYRDCFGGGANFDQYIPLTVFSAQDYIFDVEVQRGPIEELIYNPYENCDPNAAELCVEKTEYVTILQLPQISETYTISYQRCCWAADIINIQDPASSGITIETSISPLGQEICNSQYQIDFPTAFASCPNEPAQMQLPLFDSEGDSLSYELCFPLSGGGDLGTAGNPGDVTQCDGLTPTPACPPPYETLQFATGFDEENPFPTENGVFIDPATNIISFTPTELGRYVYGLCATEYRDGEILGFYSQNLHLANIVQDISNVNRTKLEWKAFYSRAGQKIVFNSDQLTSGIVTLLDLEGREIAVQTMKAQDSIEFDCSGLTAGIYVLSIVNHGVRSSKKVLVQN